MESTFAISTFAALAQDTRLDAFRLLVSAGSAGMAAGDIARSLAIPHNTMSSHLAVLARTGIVVAERQSRSIIYRANLDRVRELVTFLLQDCCGGRPELCAPIIDALTPCCTPERTP